MEKIQESFFREHIPERKNDAHKGDFGKVLLMNGSCGMAGAAVLSGRAALRSGSGLVRFLLPSFADPIYPVLQTSVPEATCVAYQEDFNWEEYDAIAAGSGLGNDPVRLRMLKDLMQNYAGTLVLDADALNAIARGSLEQELVSCKAKLILTPHIGEAKRLLHSDAPIRTEQERLAAAETLAKTYHAVVVLKGAGTLVASEEAVLQNTTGNPGMACGGSGDVLTGIITSLAGQGLRAFDAAACGAFLHGKAGDEAAAQLGQACMCAGDLITYLPDAWLASIS